MPNAETARLIASLELQDKFTPGVNKAVNSLGRLDVGISRSSGRAFKAGQQIGTGIKNGALIAAGGIGFLATQVGFGIRQLGELEDATTATNAALKSTKNISGQTGESIRALAEKYETLNATIDDKVIQSGENVLLTFTAIRKEAFEPALEAALNLSVGMKQDLQTSVVQVGKALNDPIKGLTTLTRVGVRFTAEQREQIKTLVKTGDVLGAQRIILAELGTEFGGRFAAQGKTAKGVFAAIGDAGEDLQRTLAEGLFPTVQKVLPRIREALASPEVIAGVKKLGEGIASLFSDENIKAGGAFLKDAFETAKSAAPVVAAAAKTTFGFVKGAVGLFKSLPPEIQKLAVAGFAVNKLTGGLVTNIAGGIISEVGKQFFQRGGTPANPLFVADVAGGLGGAGAAGAAGAAAGDKSLASKALGIASKVFVVGLAAEAASLLSGPVVDLGKTIHTSLLGENNPLSDFGKAWTNWQQNADWPFGQKNAPEWAGGKGPQVDPAFKPNVETGIGAIGPAIRAALGPTFQKLRSDGSRDIGEFVESHERDIAEFSKSVQSSLASAIQGLKTSNDPTKIAAAIKVGLEGLSKGKGNVDTTKNVLSGLKAALANTHDPKLQASLREAIKKLEGRLPAREFAAKQLGRLDKILSDGKVTNKELRTVQGIERALKDRGLPHAAQVIRQKVAEAQRAQVAAADRTAAAVRRKKTLINVNNTISVSAKINPYENSRVQTTMRRGYVTLK